MSKKEDLLAQQHLNDLKKNAFAMPSGYGKLEDLCDGMAKISATGLPVKATFNGCEFVIDKNTSPKKAMRTYVDTAYNFESYSKEALSAELDFAQKMPKDGEFEKMVEAKMVAAMVQKYPQDAEKISTLQLMGAYNYFTGLDNDAAAEIEPVLNKSIEKYMAGEETFAPTLQNYEHVRLLHGYMFHSNQCSDEQSEARLYQVEEKILQDPDMLFLARSKDLHVAYLLARKHENDDVLGKITQKIAQEKVAGGNSKP